MDTTQNPSLSKLSLALTSTLTSSSLLLAISIALYKSFITYTAQVQIVSRTKLVHPAQASQRMLPFIKQRQQTCYLRARMSNSSVKTTGLWNWQNWFQNADCSSATGSHFEFGVSEIKLQYIAIAPSKFQLELWKDLRQKPSQVSTSGSFWTSVLKVIVCVDLQSKFPCFFVLAGCSNHHACGVLQYHKWHHQWNTSSECDESIYIQEMIRECMSQQCLLLESNRFT